MYAGVSHLDHHLLLRLYSVPDQFSTLVEISYSSYWQVGLGNMFGVMTLSYMRENSAGQPSSIVKRACTLLMYWILNLEQTWRILDQRWVYTNPLSMTLRNVDSSCIQRIKQSCTAQYESLLDVTAVSAFISSSTTTNSTPRVLHLLVVWNLIQRYKLRGLWMTATYRSCKQSYDIRDCHKEDASSIK